MEPSAVVIDDEDDLDLEERIRDARREMMFWAKRLKELTSERARTLLPPRADRHDDDDDSRECICVDEEEDIVPRICSSPATLDMVATQQLERVFGLTSFRPLQLETIQSLESGRDTLTILPTGSGKSMCFLLYGSLINRFPAPSYAAKGTAKRMRKEDATRCTVLVISPLISVIDDQVLRCSKYPGSVRAVALTGAQTNEQQSALYRDLKAGLVDLLYSTPERLSKSKRLRAVVEHIYQQGRLSLLVIDEAHCVSDWGHDFRPDYRRLKVSVRDTLCPKTPLLALTATATKRVEEDIVRSLFPVGHPSQVLRGHWDRPNLFYRVVSKPDSFDKCIVKIVTQIQMNYANERGIVYCFSKKESEDVSKGLRQSGIKCMLYNGDCSEEFRQLVRRKWAAKETHVVVATVAFGMGIDEPDVRFVIHFTISKSLQNYVQESGRCGRDGRPADCILLFRPQDVMRVSSIALESPHGAEMLLDMCSYALGLSACRRSALATSLGHELPITNRSVLCCDICSSDQEVERSFCDWNGAAELCRAIDELHSIHGLRGTLKQWVDAQRGRSIKVGAASTSGGANGANTGIPTMKYIVVDAKGWRLRNPPKWDAPEAEVVLVYLLVQKYLSIYPHYTAYQMIPYIELGDYGHVAVNSGSEAFSELGISSVPLRTN